MPTNPPPNLMDRLQPVLNVVSRTTVVGLLQRGHVTPVASIRYGASAFWITSANLLSESVWGHTSSEVDGFLVENPQSRRRFTYCDENGVHLSV